MKHTNLLSFFQISIFFVGLFCISFLTGCNGDVNEFFDKKTIEIHSKDIIREMGEIPVIPDINNPLPDYYLSPPQIKTFSESDTKLYYFTRNNTPKTLAELVKAQLKHNVSINEATNHVIVKCGSEDQALQALDFLEQVDVPPIQIRIDCLISEMFADATLDWETTLEIQDLFGNGGGGVKTVGDVSLRR